MRNQMIVNLREVCQHHLAPIDKTIKRLSIGSQHLILLVQVQQECELVSYLQVTQLSETLVDGHHTWRKNRFVDILRNVLAEKQPSAMVGKHKGVALQLISDFANKSLSYGM